MIVLIVMAITLTMLMAALLMSDAELAISKAVELYETTYYSAESAAQIAMSEMETILPQYAGPYEGYLTADAAEIYAQTQISTLQTLVSSLKARIERDDYNGDAVTVAIELHPTVTTTASYQQLEGTLDISGQPLPPTIAPGSTRFASYVNYEVVVTSQAGSRTVSVQNGTAYTVTVTTNEGNIATSTSAVGGGTTEPADSGTMFTGVGVVTPPSGGYTLNGQPIPFTPPSNTVKPPVLNLSNYRATVLQMAQDALSASGANVVTMSQTNPILINGNDLQAQHRTGLVINRGDATLVGDFTGITIFTRGNLTLGTDSVGFTQANPTDKQTYMYAAGWITANANTSFVQTNAMVGCLDFGLNNTAGTPLVRTDSLYYITNILHLDMHNAAWDSSFMPQFYSMHMNGYLIPEIAASGVFYATDYLQGVFGANLPSSSTVFSGFMISPAQFQFFNNTKMDINPAVPPNLNPEIAAYLNLVYNAGGSGVITYTQDVTYTITLTPSGTARTNYEL